MFRGFNILQTS